MRRLIHRLAAASAAFSLSLLLTPEDKVVRVVPPAVPPVAQASGPGRIVLGAPAERGGALDLAVLENGEAWAVGLDPRDATIMWHSRDGGRTWETRAAPNGGWVLSSIHFADERHGWAAGSGDVLVRTADGGRTWERLNLPTRMNWMKVRFVNPRVGYVAGGTGHEERATGRRVRGLKILRTDDGGKSWRVCYRDGKSDTVWNIATLSEEVAVVAVDGRSLLRTEDGGRTWKSVLTHGRAGLKHVAFDARGVGWAVGERGFYRSIDEGRTWQTPAGLPPELLTRDWWSVDFADAEVGLAVSEDCAVAVTYDGGRTWREVASVYHQGKVMWTSGLAERLRGVRLRGGRGLIFGSQSLYPVESFGRPGAAR